MKISKLTQTALVTAVICITTLFTSLPLPFSNGFFNLGDFAIIAAIIIFKDKYTVFAAGLGSAIADMSLGYLQYLPFTLLIKTLEAFIILSLLNKKVNHYIALAVALTTMAVGYGIADAILIQTPSYFWISFGANMIQATTTFILSLLAYPLLSKLNKNKTPC